MFKQIKINCYASNGEYKSQIKNIKNINRLEFNEIFNGGQGGFNIDLASEYDSFDIVEGDLIEYIIFSDEYKDGIYKFSGVVRGISRYKLIEGQGKKIKIDGLVSLLSDYEIAKTYNGTLKNIISTFVNDFHTYYNLVFPLEYLGKTFFKNKINSEIEIDVSVDGNFFKVLEKIFEAINEGKEEGEKEKFFINHRGEILLFSEIKKEHIFTFNRHFNGFETGENGEINIELSRVGYDVQVGDSLILENVVGELDLSGKKIQELAFSLDKTIINAGNVFNYRNLG